jgi:hypothetical protein
MFDANLSFSWPRLLLPAVGAILLARVIYEYHQAKRGRAVRPWFSGAGVRVLPEAEMVRRRRFVRALTSWLAASAVLIALAMLEVPRWVLAPAFLGVLLTMAQLAYRLLRL